MNKQFYRAFEDRFRGSRDLIKARLSAYIDFITIIRDTHEIATGLDLGCGRGEWLEVLQENGIAALGIDMDQGMLDACRERHLNVLHGDAIEHLSNQPSNSLSIISAFHFVEHIAFEDLQKVVLESLRVLRPGGLLILETPNPENIEVASCNFYLDPTHQRPIPPQLLAFLPEYCGFVKTSVVRLQEPKPLEKLDKPSLRDVLQGVSPDYAVIAQKLASPEILQLFTPIFDKNRGISLNALIRMYDKFTEAKQAHAFQNTRTVTAELQSTQNKLSIVNKLFLQAQIEIKDIRINLQAVSNQLQQTTQDLQRLEIFKQSQTEQAQAIYNSTSWKITRPLRWVALQGRLVKQHGLSSRIKAGLSKLRYRADYHLARPDTTSTETSLNQEKSRHGDDVDFNKNSSNENTTTSFHQFASEYLEIQCQSHHQPYGIVCHGSKNILSLHQELQRGCEPDFNTSLINSIRSGCLIKLRKPVSHQQEGNLILYVTHIYLALLRRYPSEADTVNIANQIVSTQNIFLPITHIQNSVEYSVHGYIGSLK